jgi:hypothetical protein
MVRYKDILSHITNLKKFLKSEVAIRKDSELHFESLIDNKI